MNITGNTRLFAIIADPIKQVRTPEVLNEYFKEHKVDAVLVPIQVAAEDLEQTVQALRNMKNLDGFIVTVPHKSEITALCDELGEAGAAIGAVNTVRRTSDGKLLGNMFDGTGFVSGLRTQGHDPKKKRVLLLGAGGAAAAIAHALAEAGAAEIVITNRTLEKAQQLAERMQSLFPDVAILAGENDPRGYDMVVNATSLGMKESDPLPVDASLLEPKTVVAEIIMKPVVTALLAAAQERGCAVHFGRHMLDEQVRLMAEFMLDPSDRI